jgi:hypothetical protein
VTAAEAAGTPIQRATREQKQSQCVGEARDNTRNSEHEAPLYCQSETVTNARDRRTKSVTAQLELSHLNGHVIDRDASELRLSLSGVTAQA